MKIKKILTRAAGIIGVALFWLGIWALVSFRVNSELLFPTPSSVISALFELASTSEFWVTASFSLLRVVAGIIISLVVGSLLAVLTERSKVLGALLSPVLGVVKSTPVASFIILALLWIDRNTLPLYITSLIVVPIVWSNVSEGIRSVDKDLVDVAKIYKFSVFKKITKLYVPSVAPFFMAACKSSLGMAWKAGISAEVLSTPKYAIGTELYFSKTYLETPTLFAWTAVIIVLSVIIEKLFVWGLSALAKKMRLVAKGDGYGKI